ncbi:predicted protein, partial [Nematostella vectensis]
IQVFKDGLETLKRQFPNQTKRFWRILRTRCLAHLKEKHPRQPLVILLGAPPSAHPVANCLALRLANILDPETEHIENVETVNGKDLQNIEGDIAKKKLDESLHGTFDKGRRAAVVKHLELLPPPSENLFYAYCDNDNARFKHAAILFTVHLQMEPHSSLRPVEAEGMVEKFLSD